MCLGFLWYVDWFVGIYSGGNKCKLVMVLVLVGDLVVVFLDELIIGMDFSVWCFFWNSFLVVVWEGCLVMFIFYSMEECEVFCLCLVIMVNGWFCCLGSL